MEPLSFSTTFPDLSVPQLQFNNMTNYGNTFARQEISVQPLINKLAFRAASAAQPVPILSSYQNETYHREFYAPAVQCDPSANTSRVRNISIEIADESTGGSGRNFIAWAGTEDQFPLKEASATTLDYSSRNGSRIFVVTTAGTSDITYNFTSSSHGDVTARQSSVVECVLHNASYSVQSVFQYPAQTHQVSISQWLDPMGASQFQSLPLREGQDEYLSYLTIMSAFGKILAGTGSWNHYGGGGAYLSSWDILDINWETRETIPRQLEQLFQNITLSLLSDSGLMRVSEQSIFRNVTTYASNTDIEKTPPSPSLLK